MKVVISTDQGYVSAHFGRCPSYTIVEIKEGKILNREEIPNPGHQPGFLPQYLSERGVSYIIAGGMGHRAKDLFSQKNIETITGVEGTIDEVISKLINQELKAGDDLCGHRHGKVSPFAHEYSLGAMPHKSGDRICITSKGTSLDAEVDPAFGRAQYFLLINPETMDVEVLENTNKDAAQGAGIQTAQLISEKNVKTILTGSCGPNAQRVLQSSGITVITGITGKVKEALSKYKMELE
ncbi:MAG: NifB/NifX family molybdenum-iron cluster-binding protein [Acidobacteriota bacterium]|nr:NifB/NifX family molybdenum-iron cluster-binding protein [Acidobacteriota bacterium]